MGIAVYRREEIMGTDVVNFALLDKLQYQRCVCFLALWGSYARCCLETSESNKAQNRLFTLFFKDKQYNKSYLISKEASLQYCV